MGILSTALAQQSQVNSSSVYSYLGLGTPYDNLSPIGSGMSMIGVAIPDPFRASAANPALWGGTNYTVGSGSFSISNFAVSDDFDSGTNTNFDFGHFQIVAPVIRNRLGISLAMYPETNSRFQITTTSNMNLPTADSTSSVGYTNNNVGVGGLNRLEAGFGLRLTDNIMIGYAPSLMFGVETIETRLFFEDARYRTVNYSERTRYRGFAHRFGLAASAANILRSNDRVVFGATASLPVDLSSHKRFTSRIQAGNNIRDIDLVPEDSFGKQTINYPFETTVGLSYFPRTFFMIGAEVHYQQWSELNTFEGTDDPFTKDRLRVAFGLEYDAGSRFSEGFFRSFAYRFGTSYDNGHLTLNNQNIETIMFTAGIGIPSRAFGSSIDINFDYGIRGTTSNSLVRERIFAVRASFNLTEPMFIQRRLN